ncbi:tetratricopeptide repeat protein [Paraglaciecola aquimarina]|uniref:Tetratricopeptide repeat protein n=1 Tax=Paraglaciecola algarum TaxID=3050085 RepID=A0ABS9D3P6_9ALTE|nr:tetratricopeptide repeat protein [Paraglaciecola sp. G1-23]MCF2947562.1 tetratricopeptide repeat protein [Paraglaciecola sp. G1-23]
MSNIDVAFKWAVTLKIIKDLNKSGDLVYSDELLGNDLGTSYKSIHRWTNQKADSPRLHNYEVKLKDNFGISLNTILKAQTISELVLGLSQEMADTRFDDKKVKFYINLYGQNEISQAAKLAPLPTEVCEKENAEELESLNLYFQKAPSEPLYLNELTLSDKHAITQYYKGMLSSWVPIRAKVPIPASIYSIERYHNYPYALKLKNQIRLLVKEKLTTVLKIYGPAGSGKTTRAYELSYELSKKGETCLLRNSSQDLLNVKTITAWCHNLQAREQRLFLFYDSPSQTHYSELNTLLNEVNKTYIDNLTIAIFDSEKNAENQTFNSINLNTYTYHMDERYYDESLLDLYCEKLISLEMFDIPILSETQTIEEYKEQLTSKKVKIPLVMAYELTNSKLLTQKLISEFSDIRSDTAKEIFQFTLLLSKFGIWISDEFYTSIYDVLEYRKVVNQDLAGLLCSAKNALYVRDISIAQISSSQIFTLVEEEIRFIRDYLKHNLANVKVDHTKAHMSRMLAEIAYKLMANTENAEIVVEYINDIFHTIEKFINVRDFRAMLYNTVATFLIKNGKEKQGIDIYHLGIKNVESEHFYMQLARFYLLEKNDEEKALKYLKSCIKKSTNVIVITEYCRQLVEVGSINKAIKLYKKTINEFPDDPGIFTSYAMLLYSQNRTEEALSVFQQGSLGKPDTQLYTAWIKTLLKLKKDQLALDVFDEAKANIVPESGIYAVIANHFCNRNKLKIAEALCEEGLKFNPTAHHIAITAKVLRYLRKFERAHEILNKYGKHDDAYLVAERFSLHYEAQQYDLCVQTILKTKKKVLEDTNYLYFANKLYQQQQYEHVESVCKKALEVQKHPDLYVLCAKALQTQNKPIQSVEFIVEGLREHNCNKNLLRALCANFTDENTGLIIDILRRRLNLKNLLLNSPFVIILLSAKHQHNCLSTIYSKVKMLLNSEMRKRFTAELKATSFVMPDK